MQPAHLERYRADAEKTAGLQRQIQRETDQRDRRGKSNGSSQAKQKAVQAGDRPQPAGRSGAASREAGHRESMAELSEAHLDMTMRTNVYGYFHMAKAALRHLKSGGCIVNTGSETGLFGSPALLDYSATKGAIHAFTKSLATQLAPAARANRVSL